MTIALSAFPPSKRRDIALRRIKNNTGGHGYHASVDYMVKTEPSHPCLVGLRTVAPTKTVAEEVQTKPTVREILIVNGILVPGNRD